MAQITLTIPDNKVDWLLNGASKELGYQDNVPNPSFDPELPEDPSTNASTIPNPQSKGSYVKENIKIFLKNLAIRGHQRDNHDTLASEADSIDIT